MIVTVLDSHAFLCGGGTVVSLLIAALSKHVPSPSILNFIANHYTRGEKASPNISVLTTPTRNTSNDPL